MDYVMDPTLSPQMMMDDDDIAAPPQMIVNTPPQTMRPEVVRISAPKFNLVLPFASFDRSTPTKFAGSILNWTALIACFIWVYLLGRFGFMSSKTISVFIVSIIFTLSTTVLLSTSAYQRS